MNPAQRKAMKLALEALNEHEGNYKLGKDGVNRVNKAIATLREALAQPAPAQETVALEMDGKQLTLGEAMDEAIAATERTGAMRLHAVLIAAQNALYTATPAQRQPLTLGQKQKLWSSVGEKPTLKDRVNAYGLAIEAAHGITEVNQ